MLCCATPRLRHAGRTPPLLAAAALLPLLVYLLLATTAQAEPDVVFLTSTTHALASDIGSLRTACSAVQSNASAFVSLPTDSFAKLTAAMTAAAVDYAYVSAMMDTSMSNVWLWHPGGDMQAWDGVVTTAKWAPNYPVNDSSVPYAVYSATLDGLMNIDGTASYPIACMYSYYVAPEVVPKEKKKFPWWAILIIVLGSVAIIAVIVTVVVCCCCCKKGDAEDGEEAKDDEYPNRSQGESRSAARRSGASSSHHSSDNESEMSSAYSGDTGSNRSFSRESAKESRNGRAHGRME